MQTTAEDCERPRTHVTETERKDPHTHPLLGVFGHTVTCDQENVSFPFNPLSITLKRV
jgi:hypothetical protein